ncbi:Methyltransferase domain-containing protein [Haladaptatus litoreus]|uniref:Methyltransferase domain-containing protein n=1 Tax=Haladaptatus litoreus TaxID=553468 RepID=A0A1N7DW68_9EURY|nr:class I SAM-dependent methyltransferase [Haladaptatus litoreus]SIR80082.1 Methyltransferase domain-containing protein [Haladaptatus litoreus]
MSNQSESETDDPARWWNEVYESETAPPWDTGKPQPALVNAVKSDGLSGRVLDVGCGTGTHALWVAAEGHTAVGIDFSEKGIEQAREKAEERGLDATFRVADALDVPEDIGTFDTVLDSGLFHAFQNEQREDYARELAGIVPAGGRVFLVGFAKGAPEDGGPNPLTPTDVSSAFAEEWNFLETQEVTFETRETSFPGLLSVVERV